jgi:hypothetical protein
MADLLVSQIVTSMGGLVLLVASGFAFRAFGNARLLSEASPTPLASLTEGLHEVAGRMQATGELTAPLTGRACIWYRLLLEQRRRNRWESVLDQREALPTELADDGGVAGISIATADVVVSSADRVRTGIFAVPSADLDALLSRVSATTQAPSGPFLRWREEILLDGDRIFAIGQAEREGDGWSMAGGPGGALLLSDREEADVVRHQRRAGQRWAVIGIAGLLVGAFGVYALVG